MTAQASFDVQSAVSPAAAIPSIEDIAAYPKACACGSIIFSLEMERKHRCRRRWEVPPRRLSSAELSALYRVRSSAAAWCEACGRLNDQPRPFRLPSGETVVVCGDCRRECRRASPFGPRSLLELRDRVRAV